MQTITYESGASINQEILVSGINKASSVLASRMVFGYHSEEDISQQIALYTLQAMERWDGERCVAAFSYTHSKNRLFNFKRDTYTRPLPCQCHSSESCAKCQGIQERNRTKKNLHHFQSLDNNYISNEPLPEENMIYNELFFKFSGAMPHELIDSYIDLVNGNKIDKIHHKEIKLICEGLLNG